MRLAVPGSSSGAVEGRGGSCGAVECRGGSSGAARPGRGQHERRG
jgi:hypothetical protein